MRFSKKYNRGILKMKKKLLCMLIVAIMALSPVSVFADEKDDKIVELEEKVKELEEQVKTLEEKLSKYENGSEIENYLLEKGLLSGNRTEMAAEMVGAISGFKYGETEIYEYADDSVELKTLSEGNSITLEGFGVEMSPVCVNENYVMFGTASDELIKAFEEYK